MIDLNDDGFQVLLVQPWENASADHWMSIWKEKYPLFARVEQKDWSQPNRDEWIETLDKYVGEQTKPVFLVAHSLGTITLAHWAYEFNRRIAGAFLVAPPDVERADSPLEIRSFAPIPLAKFTFPSLVVASENDNYCSISRAMFFAESWGSRFENIGEAGHINTKSSHGDWGQGEKLLRVFIEQILSGKSDK
jgi:hypothetical protein